MDTILCATDGSADSDRALELAADLANMKNAKLLVLHVQTTHGSALVPPGYDEYERIEHVRVTEADILRSAANRIAQEGTRRVRDKGIDDVEAIVAEGSPAKVIVDTAKARDVDAIVVGSRGLGEIQGLLLGSVSHKVTHLAPCTCIVAR